VEACLHTAARHAMTTGCGTAGGEIEHALPLRALPRNGRFTDGCAPDSRKDAHGCTPVNR